MDLFGKPPIGEGMVISWIKESGKSESPFPSIAL